MFANGLHLTSVHLLVCQENWIQFISSSEPREDRCILAERHGNAVEYRARMASVRPVLLILTRLTCEYTTDINKRSCHDNDYAYGSAFDL